MKMNIEEKRDIGHVILLHHQMCHNNNDHDDDNVPYSL